MPLPISFLDDLEWSELFEEARARIPAQAARWTDHNIHDPGITMLDLFAWVTEQTSYRIDHIPDSHRARFAELLDVRPRVATAAMAVLQLTTPGPPRNIPAGTKVLAHAGSNIIPFLLTRAVRATKARVTAVTSAGGMSHPPGPTPEPFAPLGPDGSGMLTVTFQQSAFGPMSFWVQTADTLSPDAGPHHSVVLQWQQRTGAVWRDLSSTNVTDGTAALTRSGFVDLTLSGASMVRCHVHDGRYDKAPLLGGVVGNATIARQLQQRSVLDQRPTSTLAIDLGSDGVQEVEMSSHDNTPATTKWAVVRTPPRAPDAAVAFFSPATGVIQFSDGRWGRRPRLEERFRINITDSKGQRGDVQRGAKWTLPEVRAKVEVDAPWGASGGARAETASDAITRAAERLWAHERLLDLAMSRDVDSLDRLPRTPVIAAAAPERAVTALDYERLALATPGVSLARAKAWPDLDLTVPCALAPGTVSVTIVPHLPRGRPVPTERLIRAVGRHLAGKKTLGTRLLVRGPDYAPVTIAVKVSVLEGVDPEKVNASVDAAVREWLDPLRGGPDGLGWPFGRDVYRTEIMAAVAAVAGVDLVADVWLGTEPGCSNLCVSATHLVAIESLNVQVRP